MDPYVTDDAKLNYSLIDTLVGKFTVRQVNTYGLVDGQVQAVRVNFTDDFSSMRMSINIFFPKSSAMGSYGGNARLGIIPFRSGGPFNLTVTNTLITWLISGKVKKVKGIEFMEVQSFKFKPTVGDLKLNMEGIFASKQLTKAAVNLLNGRWKYLLRQLLPETQRYFEPELVKNVNKIFMKIPYNVLLPFKKGQELLVDGNK